MNFREQLQRFCSRFSNSAKCNHSSSEVRPSDEERFRGLFTEGTLQSLLEKQQETNRNIRTIYDIPEQEAPLHDEADRNLRLYVLNQASLLGTQYYNLQDRFRHIEAGLAAESIFENIYEEASPQLRQYIDERKEEFPQLIQFWSGGIPWNGTTVQE